MLFSWLINNSNSISYPHATKQGRIYRKLKYGHFGKMIFIELSPIVDIWCFVDGNADTGDSES